MAIVTASVPTRRHLFEFEDLGWFPVLFRNAITDWLAATFTGIYEPVVPLVVRLLDSAGTERLVDLCSGGSGPWEYLKAQVDAELAAKGGSGLALTLTDRYPNVPAFSAAAARLGGETDFRADPVDARNVPDDLKGVRTLFTAFHHLKPADARAVLADAAGAGRAIGVFEFTRRDWKTIREVMWQVPLSMVRSYGAWKPRKRSQLALVPFIITTSLWDAVVSQLRAYTQAELRSMTEGLGGDDYRWEIGEVFSPESPEDPITYVIGYPTAGS